MLQNLKILEITENPISQTTILQDFIIYRFPKIERINEIELTCSETDPSRKKARLLFENFDKILQLPEKTPKAVFWSKKLGEVKKKSKTGALKQVNRLVNEASEKFLSGILFETHEEKRLEYEFEKHWSSYLDKLIKQN